MRYRDTFIGGGHRYAFCHKDGHRPTRLQARAWPSRCPKLQAAEETRDHQVGRTQSILQQFPPAHRQRASTDRRAEAGLRPPRPIAMRRGRPRALQKVLRVQDEAERRPELFVGEEGHSPANRPEMWRTIVASTPPRHKSRGRVQASETLKTVAISPLF